MNKNVKILEFIMKLILSFTLFYKENLLICFINKEFLNVFV